MTTDPLTAEPLVFANDTIVVTGASSLRGEPNATGVSTSDPTTPAKADNVELDANNWKHRQTDRNLHATSSDLQPRPNTDRRRGGSAAIDQLSWSSAAARKLHAQLTKVASLDSTVLLTGESGTGKTTIARMIHQRSSRGVGPFVAVNCASLPRELIDAELFGHALGAFTGAVRERQGRAESASGGTLFLDEIGDLPLDVQPKLLTFLQERTFHRIGCNESRSVDVRIIAATHRDLAEMCTQRLFRRDLYFRMAVLRLEVPALRDRRADIREMTAYILRRLRQRRQETPARVDALAMEAIEQYDWPGNIRELENILENAAAFCGRQTIRIEDLNLSTLVERSDGLVSQKPAAGLTLAGLTLAEVEKRAIVDTLGSCQGNKARTAHELGISEKSIYNKMRRHGLLPQ